MGDKSPKAKQKADKQKKQDNIKPAIVAEPTIAGKGPKATAAK